MIESIMYFGAGFLFAALIGVAVIPLVHNRAVRLTIRRLENSIPQSMAEIQADKDALRAEFAVSTRRLEVTVEQLKNKSASQLAEIGRKSDAINRLKIEREAQKVEALALKVESNSLKDELIAVRKEVEAAESQRHERNDIPLVPNAWSPVEPAAVPAGSSQNSLLDLQSHIVGRVSVPEQGPKAEEVQSDQTARDPSTGLDTSDQYIGTAREESDALPQMVEPSIKVPPRTPDFISSKPSIGARLSRNVIQFSIAVLVGFGAIFAWQSQNDEAREAVTAWASALNSLIPLSAAKLPSDVRGEQSGTGHADQLSAQDTEVAKSATATQESPASATATSPELVNQPKEAVERDFTSKPQGAEQLAAKPEEGTQNIPTLNPVVKDVSFPAQQTWEKPAPSPVMKPTAIADWALQEVIDGTAVLQGPNGTLRVTRGDTVPGLGRVDSIVRWGNRWIVATSLGYCKSDPPNQPAEDRICKPYRGY